MNRRAFITLLGGAAAAWPYAARAQQPATPMIGYLYLGSPAHTTRQVAAFRRGLSEVGYVEGRNVAIEFRWADNEIDRLPGLAADLVSRRVAVIVTPFSGTATRAARAATTTIPIVFTTGVDPVEAGFVASLNRPGGNLTGLTAMNSELAPKQLGLLREFIPGAARLAVLVPRPSAYTATVLAQLEAAASPLGWQIEGLHVGTISDIDAAFASLVQKRSAALLVTPEVLFFNSLAKLVTLAAHHTVPAIYWTRDFTEAGGLMSYGADVTDQLRQAGIYTGRLLKGEKPVSLPVLRATKFEFVINLKTAKELGVKISDNLLSLADEVIE
jgi:putative ABC transport system substrate-binding protein